MAKRCKVCKEKFEPTFNTLQATCSPKCAIDFAGSADGREFARKQRKKEAREERKRYNQTRIGWWREEAQKAFNKYIRTRDAALPCISCGITTGQMHAGHYRSRGAAPELRYEPLNCHKQCAQCNEKKSGNIVEYRINLIDRIGEDLVDWLEGPHDTKKYTIDDLREIRDNCNRLTKELEDRRAA